VKVLVIATHDPDGGTWIDVFVDGQRIRDDALDVVPVDAGRGYTWDDWKENRDHWLDRSQREHGRRARSAVEAAFDDPPGGGWIDGKPEEEPWV
jgi:hypothetical protein